jgi:hypothetical protein
MPTAQRNLQEAAEHLACDWGACRVSFTWMGTRKALTKEQKETTAECFGANPKWLSGSKKLWNTANKAYRAVTDVKKQIREYWEGNTLPYVEDGVRLIRQDRIDQFNDTMREFRRNLGIAVIYLDQTMDELIREARGLLGDTFDRANYPDTFAGKFDVEWDFPSLAPPEYLATLNPRLFAEHSARIASRFEEVARRTEEAFIAELAGLIDELQAKLAGEQDGKAKRLHEANIEQVREFFDRFRRLNLHSSEQLDHVVDQAERAMTTGNLFGETVTADEIRDSSAVRQTLASRLAAVGAQLDGMMVDRPRRAINRRAE